MRGFKKGGLVEDQWVVRHKITLQIPPPLSLSSYLNAVSDVISEVDDSIGDESDFDEVLADAIVAQEKTGSGRRAELEPDVAGLTTVERRQGQTGA